MRFTRIELQDWRNFLQVGVDLHERMFVVGPNASGKSNFLDAFRFLRDVAEPQGGLQHAVHLRGGISRIRSLHARRSPGIVIDVGLALDERSWRYRLALDQDEARQPIVKEEIVWSGDTKLLERPNADDRSDPGRLGQTHLEQVNANLQFRAIAEFFARIEYLHIVPQLVRDPERYPRQPGGDSFGGDFLDHLARARKENRRTFESRLRRINEALQIAVPQLEELRLERDEVTGRPHLKGLYGQDT